MQLWHQFCERISPRLRNGIHPLRVDYMTCKYRPATTHWSHYSTRKAPQGVGAPRWTQEDQDELLRLRESDMSYVQIAKILGRTRRSVETRYNNLKNGSTSTEVKEAKSRPWTAKEDAQLKDLRAQGKTFREIGKNYLNRTVASVQQRIIRDHSIRGRRQDEYFISCRPWTRQEDDRLRAMIAEGKRIDAIALVLGREYGAVVHRRMSIIDRGKEPSYDIYYTEEEDSLLLSLRKSGLKFGEIQQRIPNRRLTSLAQRYRKISSSKRNVTFNSGRTWLKEDIEDLRVMRFEKKLLVKVIATKMGRTFSSITYALGEFFGERRPGNIPWSEEETVKLHIMRTVDKKPWKEIAAVIGRSINACRGKYDNEVKFNADGTPRFTDSS